MKHIAIKIIILCSLLVIVGCGLYFLIAGPSRTPENDDSGTDPEVDRFVEMVLANLSKVEHYTLPKDNSASYNPQDSNVYDYGTFDFIIIGGGTAGTLLANRLTEILDWKVLLLEAGGPVNEFTDIPGLATSLQYSDNNWGYNSTPQTSFCKGMERNVCFAPRGKVLGGGSTINAKIYVRGHKDDFNNWEKLGNKGWSYSDILPYFTKTENSLIDGEDGYHGIGGPLDVSYPESTPFLPPFLQSCQSVGQKILDYNGKIQTGANQVQFNIRGIKALNGARVFIDPIMDRKNFHLALNAHVSKILIHESINTAYGVEFVKDGKYYKALASKEVILSAGSFNSPQILMLSGIGPKDELNKIGVKVINDLPVGQNLQDHPVFVGLNFRTNITLFNQSTVHLIKEYLKGHRPYTVPFGTEAVSFANVVNRTDVNSAPHVEILLMSPPGLGHGAKRVFNLNDDFAKAYEKNYNHQTDIQFWLILLRPKSRGTVTLKSSNPVDFPNLDFNFFTDPQGEDIEFMYRGILEVFRIAEADPFKAVDAKYSSVLGACNEFVERSKEYWYCAIRHLTSTLYHPTSTCRMGSSLNSVVGSDMSVHRMKRLRVVDASVFPLITSGHTNSPVLMVAEKISDEIKRQHGKL